MGITTIGPASGQGAHFADPPIRKHPADNGARSINGSRSKRGAKGIHRMLRHRCLGRRRRPTDTYPPCRAARSGLLWGSRCRGQFLAKS